MQHESSNGSRHDCPSGKCTERVSEKSRGEERLRSSWRERGRQGCEPSNNGRE